MRDRTASRGRLRPASIMPSIAAWMASDFIFMKSVSVLSRSKTIARIKRFDLPVGPAAGRGPALDPGVSLGRDADVAPEADLAVVDAQVVATGGIAAHPRLVRDRGAVAAVGRQPQQHAVLALAPRGQA